METPIVPDNTGSAAAAPAKTEGEAKPDVKDGATGSQDANNSSENANGAGKKPSAAGSAAAASIRKYKLKYGETEEEVDEAEVVRRAQKSLELKRKRKRLRRNTKRRPSFSG